MLTKKNTLWISSFILVFQIGSLVFGEFFFNSCYEVTKCKELVINPIDNILPFTIINIPLFIFIVITYKMKENIFKKWINFSLWYTPIFIFISFLLFTVFAPQGGGLGSAVSGAINLFIIATLLFVYTLVSLVIIVRGYLAHKK